MVVVNFDSLIQVCYNVKTKAEEEEENNAYRVVNGRDKHYAYLTYDELNNELSKQKAIVAYEVITPQFNTNIRPFFDIDCTVGDMDADRVLNDVIGFIEPHFPNIALSISQSHRVGKISFHLIGANYWTTMQDLCNFKNEFKREFMRLYLDTNIYSNNNQKFRLCYAVGEKSNSVPLKPLCDGSVLSDHLIQIIDENKDSILYQFTRESVRIDKEKSDVGVGDYDNSNIDEIAELINLESKKWKVGYKQWLNIGFACKSINRKDLWINISKTSDKYNLDEINEKWNGLNPKIITAELLHQYAKQCNEKRYAKIMKKNERCELDEITMEDCLREMYSDSIESIFNIDGLIYVRDSNLISASKEAIRHFILNKKLTYSSGNKMKRLNTDKALNEAHNLLYTILFKQRDNNIRDKITKDSLNKVFYKNGYYDLVEQKFVESVELPCFTRVEMDFDSKLFDELHWGHSYVKQVMNKIIIIFGDEMQRFALRSLARAIGGNFEDKVFYILTGSRNAGKGVLYDALKRSFDSYVQTIGPIIARGGNGDVAQTYRWLLTGKCDIARICWSNEGASSDVKIKPILDGNQIKNVVSGGDEIKARLLYENERSVKNNATIFMAFNDVPDCKPIDALKTCRVLPLPYSFCDEFNGLTNVKLADSGIKSWINNTEWFPMAFAWIIFQNFGSKILEKEIPQESIVYKENVILNNKPTDFADIFHKNFVMDASKDVLSSEVLDIFIQYIPSMTTTRLGMSLKNMGFQSIRSKKHTETMRRDKVSWLGFCKRERQLNEFEDGYDVEDSDGNDCVL